MKRLITIIMTIFLVVMISGCGLVPKTFGSQGERVVNEAMTMDFAFGESFGTYTGQMAEGLPNGRGRFAATNEAETNWAYDGEWVKGYMQGVGQTIWDNGLIQKGKYVNDYLNGPGEEYWRDLLIYEGNYTNGTYDGQGRLYNYFGDLFYEGDFDMGYLNETADEREVRLAPLKSAASELSYDQVFAEAENQTGKIVKLTGKVPHVLAGSDDSPYYCNFVLDINGDSGQMVAVYYRLNTDEAPVVENQTVTVWGTIESIYTFNAEDFGDISIPEIEAWSVE